MSVILRIAIAKGRILDETLALLASAGIAPRETPSTCRKLILATADPGVELVVVRAADVDTYVRYGACDLGVTGKDVLLENGGDDLYELVDLGVSVCRMIVARLRGAAAVPATRARLRIATKYPHITRRHFTAKGVQTEVIKLYGSMELAPLAGLADGIVDLTATGGTLHANGLVEVEHIADITARLVGNRAAMKLKQPLIVPLVERIRQAAKHS